MEKANKKNKFVKGYITLMIVILLIPFLLLQGINLVNIGIDITHVSTNSIASNKQDIDEQSCWEEILYFLKNNNEILGERETSTPEITCKFSVEDLGYNKYKISLETERNNYYSFSQRYIHYDSGGIKYVASQ